MRRCSPRGWNGCAAPQRNWNESMPPIPEDATVSLGYSVKDMPPR